MGFLFFGADLFEHGSCLQGAGHDEEKAQEEA
jgi:hypothetical protein